MRQRRRRCAVCPGKGSPAVDDCMDCRRPYCGRHQALADGRLVCTTCGSRVETEGGEVISLHHT